ncbi:S-4TM family putative pore-forming effector [Sulfitobacter delicatus]|uniref:Uncharacterized protein n=1 Tax=Sulfitobacter delicatus TaxID=218672 RepID=A0A1G7U9K9_9RHOB|nr:S-4TM family putative pore-forming effector [Sulfitobacter delicatus]SDG43450.1 hypothetical protein SAMN04489759_107186 [Sulfitobacter delicatus]
MWPINEIQNAPSNLKYLAARRRTFEVCNILIVVSFLFAVGLSCVAFFLPKGKSEAAEILAIVSLIYTVIEAGFIHPKIVKTSRLNAALQEKFDCSLFDIDQNPHFAPDLSEAGIEAAALGLNDKKLANLTNWYENDLGAMTRPVAAFVAQYTSTAYDHALRRFYLKILWFLFTVMMLCGIVFLVGQNEKFRDSIVVSVVPFVPLLIWFITTIRSNSELAFDQDQTMQLMDDAWLQICKGVLKEAALKEAVRNSQDALYMRRVCGTLIFPGIYNLKRSALEGRAARTAGTFRREYEGSSAVTEDGQSMAALQG